MKEFSTFLRSTFCFTLYISYVLCYEVTVNMNSVCSYEIYHPNEEKSYKVVWKGADPGLSGCKLSFKGQDTDDYTKEYNVCVKSEKFYLQSSGIRLKYLTGFNSYADKTYVKGDNPEDFCAGNDEYLDIEVEADAAPGSVWNRIDTSQSYFTLTVTATQTNLSAGTIGAIVGGVVGGLVLLGTTITVGIIVMCYTRRGARGQVIGSNPAPTPASYPTNQRAAHPQTAVYPQPPTTGFTNQCPQQSCGFSCQPSVFQRQQSTNTHDPPLYSQLQTTTNDPHNYETIKDDGQYVEIE